MKIFSICVVLAMASTIPGFAAGVSFTCDATIAADFKTGTCGYLNGTIAGLYSSTFTNANASIYIEATNSGLGASNGVYYNLVSYATYQSALQTESTDAAKAFVPVSEPGIFGTNNISITSALAQALGITNADHAGGAATGIAGTTSSGGFCTTPGSGGCYNGIIYVNDPTDLASQTGGQGFTYRTLGSSTNGSTLNYDFFSVVEHETDELLGTPSCIGLTNSGPQNNCFGGASATDLFRYSAAGVRAFASQSPTAQYFSPNGGVTDTQGNLYNTTKSGEDWADFSQGCVFVQDAEACPTTSPATSQFDITTDGPGKTAGPEIATLNAIGYNLTTTSATPEPGTVGMLGFGVIGLMVIAYRRRLV